MSSQVTVGAGTIYGYLSLAPIILWAIFKWLEIPVTLLQNVCIYGYSLFVFLPVSVPVSPQLKSRVLELY